jgi:hypothetical protein
MRTEVLQSACDTCNLYIALQRMAHRNASRVSDTAADKIMKITEFYFGLEEKNPFPATLSKDDLNNVQSALDGLRAKPTIAALKPVFEELEGWFILSLPGFTPVGVNAKSRTSNEHNKRMLRTNDNLQPIYRIRGNKLMNEGTLDFKDFEMRRSELNHACLELRLQLETDKITVDNSENTDFEALAKSISEANGGSSFLGQTVKTIAFIEELTRLTVA